MFDNIKVKVSGGSITRRHLISTTDFNLISFLIRLGYSYNNIYSNTYFDNDHNKLVSELNKLNPRVVEDRTGLYEVAMKYLLNELDESSKELELLKLYLKKEISKLSSKVSEIKLNITDLESNGNKDLVSEKVIELENDNNKIEDCNMKISQLDSNLNLLEKFIYRFSFISTI